MHSGHDDAFGKIKKFHFYVTEQCKNITRLGFATWPSLNLSETQPRGSKHYENNYQWQQMLNEQSITLSINGASRMFGLVSMVSELWHDHCEVSPMYWQHLYVKNTVTGSLPPSENERQWSVNDFRFCKYGNCIVIWSLLGITYVLAALIGKRDSNTVTAPF